MGKLTEIQRYIGQNNYHKQLNNVLGEKSAQFIVSINNACEDYLKDCTPESVMKSAMNAAVLDLPIEKNLGFAYLIPYGQNCTFQLGYKGLIQLAQRTGKYKNINAIAVYKEQFEGYNPLTEEIMFNFKAEVDYKKQPVGYVGYFKLLNGFEKTLYWSRERCVAHAMQFSKSYGSRSNKKNIWNGNEDAMHIKTVLKQILSKYGVLSVEMQQAFSEDTESQKKDNPVAAQKVEEEQKAKELIDGFEEVDEIAETLFEGK